MRSTGTLVLAGVTVTAFMTAVQTFVQQQHSDTLQEVYSWILGGFDRATWHDVWLSCCRTSALSSVVILLHRRVLDVLALGDEEAASARHRRPPHAADRRGRRDDRAPRRPSRSAGLIGFVGIIVPHTVRLLVSTSYRAIVAAVARRRRRRSWSSPTSSRAPIISPAELPIGVVTAFFGAPFFAVVLRTTRRRWMIELHDVSVTLGANRRDRVGCLASRRERRVGRR